MDIDKLAMEVLGTCMGSIELEDIGLRYGFSGADIDLQVGIALEDYGVYRCDSCDWWSEVHEMHNDICNDCYIEDTG